MSAINYHPLSELLPSNLNPMGFQFPPELNSLITSIKTQGLFNPLRIRKAKKGFEILDGKKRIQALQYLASKNLLPRSLTKIPCLSENEDGNAVVLNDYKPFLLSDSQFAERVTQMLSGISRKSIQDQLQCTAQAVMDCQSLSNLHEEIRATFNRDHLSLVQASAFAKIPNPEAQFRLLLELGPFVHSDDIIAAIDKGDTVLSMPDGSVMILPTRSAPRPTRKPLATRTRIPEIAA